MLVTRTLGDCPRCKGKHCFGNVSVHDDTVLQGCERCRYESTILLPKIHKKVIYLDQFFFSHAFRGVEPRFLHAVERVKRMAQLSYPRQSRGFISISPSKGQKRDAPKGAGSHA